MAQRILNKLTTRGIQKFIRDAKKSSKPASKADGGGLTFTVSKSGFPAWVLRYRHNGKHREYTLAVDATQDDYGLTSARVVRDELRQRLCEGEDIAATKALTRKFGDPADLSSFRTLADEWYSRQIEPKIQHPLYIRRILDKDILPTLGMIAPEDVQAHHIDDVLQAIVGRGSPSIANDALGYIKRILTYGRKRRVVLYNVAADFDLSDAGGREKPRQRNLSHKELTSLFVAMRNTSTLGRDNELAFKILLATCVRKSELIKAQWLEFDLDNGIWHLPAERTKTDAGIDIPLALPVVAWLRELKVLAAGAAYILPNRRTTIKSTKRHISRDTLNVALKRMEHGLKDFTIHDLRRTARSRLSELGVSEEVAERALNHKLKGITAVYNQHDYFEERKKALALWADLLMALDAGKEYNVVQINQFV